MIVVARFSFPHEAHIAKANLESAGIQSFIADEHTVNTQWLYSNAIGGVRLMVSEEDFEEATEILSCDFSESLETHFVVAGEKKTFALIVEVVIYPPTQKESDLHFWCSYC